MPPLFARSTLLFILLSLKFARIKGPSGGLPNAFLTFPKRFEQLFGILLNVIPAEK